MKRLNQRRRRSASASTRLLRHPVIFNRRDSGPQAVPEEVEPSVYDEIPTDFWSREGPGAEDEE